jgi:hypothetical protein
MTARYSNLLERDGHRQVSLSTQGLGVDGISCGFPCGQFRPELAALGSVLAEALDQAPPPLEVESERCPLTFRARQTLLPSPRWVHRFALLKFFEELELGLRFGESCQQYKQRVPFLIPKLSAD